MRSLKALLVGVVVVLLCAVNVFLLHKHQHLEEVLEERDSQLRGLRKEKVDPEVRQSKASPSPVETAPVRLPPATEQQRPKPAAVDPVWEGKIAELQAQLSELPLLRNKSSTLVNENEDLEEKVEDLTKEVKEKGETIDYYVKLQKQQESKPAVAEQSRAAAGAVKMRVGREKYQKVRDELGLDNDIVITGSGGPANCNVFCNTGGNVAGCQPTCVFKQPIIVPGVKAAACIFNGHRVGDIPEDIREYGCIPVGEGMESEINYRSLANHRNDPETWTRTYRRDADAPAPYYSPQEVRMRHPAATRPLKDRIRGAVAVISNCKPAERKEVIRILRQHINVAFLGKCGDQKWPDDCSGKCTKFDVLTKYAIYLAFENSHTQDYATEKLYDGLSANAVTVAFGAPNSLELAPKNSIINIANVGEADAVGKRLKAMLDDPEMTEARQITEWHLNMEWRPLWEEKMSFTRLHSDCRLCETLRRRVVVATGGDAGSFGQLYNTVASVQKWEKGRGIMVFDMGLSEWQRDQVRAWQDTSLVDQAAFTNKRSWKMRVHAILFAVHAAGHALWLDAGVVVQNRLAAIDIAMEQDGMFLAHEADAVGDRVHALALNDLGLPAEARQRVPLYSAAVQGHSQSGLPYERVLIPVAQCVAKETTCASGPDPVNFSYPAAPLPDQGVLSVVAHTAALDVKGRQHRETAFGSEGRAGLVQVGKGAAGLGVVFRKGACVHSAGNKEDQGVVGFYAFRGVHKVRLARSSTVLTAIPGKDLDACSEADKGGGSPGDASKGLLADVARWTEKGLDLHLDSDSPKSDMPVGAFKFIPHTRVATLLECVRECWFNTQCLAFAHDPESGECWPKTQAHPMAYKPKIAAAHVDQSIRSKKKPEEWLALWGAPPAKPAGNSTQ